MAYTIKQRFLSMNRSRRTLSARGTVLHETATPGASDEDEFRYFNSGNRGASAHAFVDYDSITQTIPWNEQAGHAGPTANRNYIGIELCHYNDAARFNEVWKRAVWLFAYIHVNVINVRTINSNTLMSHAEVARRWGETDHTDPIGYFAKFGRTVEGFRREVQTEINRMTGGAGNGNTEEDSDAGIRSLQQILNRLKITDSSNSSLTVDGINGPKTISAVKKLQSICNLSVDGIAGPQTFGAINAILSKPLLQSGSTGAAVSYVQYRGGTASDGIFGPHTRAAVQRFQARNGLAIDGIVGPNTWRALIG